MKMLKHGKVILYAAVLILVSSAILIVSIYFKFRAEESKTIVGPTENIVAVSAAPAESSSATPDAQYISKEEAVGIFVETAGKVFNKPADTASLSVTFNKNRYAIWAVSDANYSAYIDALSGDVIVFSLTSMFNGIGEYSGNRITLEAYQYIDFDDFFYSTDSIYIITATDIINASLANGRKIDHIEITGVKFIWDEGAELALDTTGTLAVICDVFMETGNSYSLTLWGADQLEPIELCYYQTQDGCRLGYYYEKGEDALGYSDEWQTAPGITQGISVQDTFPY